MNQVFQGKKEMDSGEIRTAMEFCVGQILKNLDGFTDCFPKAYSEGNFYHPTPNEGWTTGFWTGELWLGYEWCRDHAAAGGAAGVEAGGSCGAEAGQADGCEASGSSRNTEAGQACGSLCGGEDSRAERLREAAGRQVLSFLERIVTKYDVDHHDMGFLYSPSCVAAWKLTGDEKGREAALLAADQLMRRFHPAGEFLQAWGAMDQPENYRLIIDCLMNVPLLFWAARETGEERYREVAEKHIHTAIANVVREDGSTWHTFYFDPKTGAPDHGATCQGYRDGSAWARGQAWGVYGSAVAYKYTGEEKYKDVFRHVTRYFLEHLPEDLIPYWDLEFTDGDSQPRDSSSASIAACGMLEMSRYLEAAEAEKYRSLAAKLLRAVYDRCAVKDSAVSNGLVLHSTYSNHSPYNTCNHCGVDECNIWGDYFYMEAMTRLTKDWEPYW